MRAGLLGKMPALMRVFPQVSYLNVDQFSVAEIERMFLSIGIYIIGGE